MASLLLEAGVTEAARVASIQQFHRQQVDLPHFQGQNEPFVEREVFISHGGQRVLDESIDPVVFPAQDAGVVRVGGDTFQPVRDGQLERAAIATPNAFREALAEHAFQSPILRGIHCNFNYIFTKRK